MRRTAALAVLLLTGCDAGGGGLVLEAPARVRQAATSDDAELCGRLTVDLTFDHKGDGQPALLLEEPLLPNAEQPCTFELPPDEERTFPRGPYDVLVRFLAEDGAYAGTCGEEAVWVGAYVLEGVSFPDEPLRFTDEDFLSRPGDEGKLPLRGASFDLDGDQRDNLAEVAAGSDPCVENLPPVVGLGGEPLEVDEGAPITLQVSSADPAGVRHRVTVRIRHEHGPQVGTEVITWRRFTDEPGLEELTPDPASVAEGWSLEPVEALGQGPGQLEAVLHLVPDEPFVGGLRIELSADDGLGNVIGTAPAVEVQVIDLDDPTVLLVEDDEGQLAPVTRLDFREVSPDSSPTERRFQLADEDLLDDVSLWRVGLAPGNPDGLTLEQDLSFWRVRWAPTNDDVVGAPDEGWGMYLQFFDEQDVPTGAAQRYPLGIQPLYNDPPLMVGLDDLDLTLSAGPFAAKTLNFSLRDPDRAGGQPTCIVEVLPAGVTSCADPWEEVRCEASGPRADDLWPFTLTLRPADDYFDACGGSPQFDVSLDITDVPPSAAEPFEAKTVSTEASCSSSSPAGCVEHLRLYTAEVVGAQVASGGPPALGSLQELQIDPAHDVGVFFGEEDGADYRSEAVFVVDLATSPPSFAAQVPRQQLCRFYEGYLRVPHAVAVDEVNGRVVGFGYAGAAADDCYDATRVVFSLSTAPPYEVQTWPLAEACANACNYFGCAGKPAADDEGNVYLPCGGDTGTLLRVDGDNQLTTRDLPELSSDQDVWGTDVVEAPDGKAWFVWPDYDGVLFVETTTWDEATVRTERLLPLEGWNPFRIGQGRADPWRQDYLLAYIPDSTGVDTRLYRVDLASGTPVLEGPLIVGDLGSSTNGDKYLRFLLKPPRAGAPAVEPDLVLTGRYLDNHRIHVDLDSFSVVSGRAAEEYWYLREVFETPDPRFYAGWVNSSTAGYEGLKLFPWDPETPLQIQQIPGTTSWKQPYMRHWSTSHAAGVSALADDNGLMRVLRFEQVP